MSGLQQKTASAITTQLLAAGLRQKDAQTVAEGDLAPAGSARTVDENDFWLIQGNPISKVGVFQYAGWQISKSLDPNKIYNVYRPQEELEDPECINSFKLVPFIDDHAMLGSPTKPGYIAAEKKGVEGTTGEEVYFEYPYLRANIKIFSERLKKRIENMKKELSMGYKCLYEIRSGVYNGIPYDAIQRKIRGNHLALVAEGRAGHDVSVLDDSKITFDSLELSDMADFKKADATQDGEPTLQSLDAKITKLTSAMDSIVEKMTKDAEEEKKATDAEEEKKTKDADEEKKAKDAEEVAKKTGDADEEKKTKDAEACAAKAMDAAVKREVAVAMDSYAVKFREEAAEKEELARKLTPFIGVFDHRKMSLTEVATHAVKALKLDVPAGQETAALGGYLQGKKPATPARTQGTGMDSKQKSTAVDAYINGSK